MADRTDIDALLIGALYGELTPADEARLTAHLESHPGDRTAMADLERTRSVVRENRLFVAQVDAPQAISALLLQEAARRAPRAPVEGWFQRFVRSVMTHPAMAAATMLVLVLGVASALYVRGVGSVASEAPQAMSASSAATEVPRAEQGATVTSAATAKPVQAVPEAVPPQESSAEPPSPAAPAAASPEGATRGFATAPKKSTPPRVALEQLKAAQDRDARSDGVASEKRLAVAKKSRGIELRQAEPAPKDLDEEASRRAYRKTDTALDEAGGAGVGGARAAGAEAKGNYPITAAVPESPAPPPPAPPPPASTAPSAAAPTPSRSKSATVSRGAPQAAKPQAPAPAADDKPEADPSLLDWAHKQHSQVRSLVAASNCRGAADAAVEIYNRAPDYYAANVATDLQIKRCMAYVNGERERVDRQRAAGKAAVEAPAAIRK